MAFSNNTMYLLVFLAASATGLARANVTQEEAIYQASVVQKQGSDASLQQSTTNAMRGLMDLAAQQRTSAIQHGYKAYGQYRNSEELDIVRTKNRINFLKLVTKKAKEAPENMGVVRELEPVADLKTSYGRLDSGFLRTGEAGKVADEFEKKSGMKREAFLKIMAKASESTISPSDPKLVDKVISRFEGFLKEIPNEDFRKNVQKTIDEVPATVRTGMIAKGVQKIAEIMAKMPADKSDLVAKTSPPDTGRTLAATSPAASGASTAVAEAPAPMSEDESDAAARQAAEAANVKMLPTESGYRGIDKENFAKGDMLGSVMQTAIEEQKEETIFKQVSKRYRAVTPMLSLVTESSP